MFHSFANDSGGSEHSTGTRPGQTLAMVENLKHLSFMQVLIQVGGVWGRGGGG